MKRMVGDEDLRRLLPGPLLQPRRRGPRRHRRAGAHRAQRAGGHQPARRRERPAHLREHQPRADGRRAQVGAAGPGDYESLRAHHDPQTIRDSDSYMEPQERAPPERPSASAGSIDKHLKVFHIETALNNRMFDGPTEFLAKNEDDFTEFDRLKFEGMKCTLSKMPRAAKRKLFMQHPGAVPDDRRVRRQDRAVHEKTLEQCWKQYAVPVEGQSDILIFPVPYISPYNVNSILNPLLVQVMGLGYLYNLYRGKPLLKKGGVMILTPPLLRRVRSRASPELHRVLQPPAARDARRDEARAQVRGGVREEPELRRHVPEGATRTTAPTRSSCGTGARTAASTSARSSSPAPRTPTCPRCSGWDRADTLTEAIDMARGFMGRSASITCVKTAPIVQCDVRT